jgi:hypothetical protein
MSNQFPDEGDRDGIRNVDSLAIQPPDAAVKRILCSINIFPKIVPFMR